jgi:hypothetical protein
MPWTWCWYSETGYATERNHKASKFVQPKTTTAPPPPEAFYSSLNEKVEILIPNLQRRPIFYFI